jgi:hypothetical protein
MLSKMLKLKDHLNSAREKVFIKIEKPSPVTESLKLLSRHQQTLIDEGKYRGLVFTFNIRLC